ncbi:hypothetical protein Ancab_007389 [Ancistrocladus abbreviatus]
MVVKVAATTCVQWTQPSISHSPSASQTLVSAITSPTSSSSCRRWNGNDGAFLVFRCAQRSPLLGTTSSKLHRAKSCEFPKQRFSSTTTIRRACSASFEAAFSDEDFSKKINELALRFQISDNDDDKSSNSSMETSQHSKTIGNSGESEARGSSPTEKIGGFNGILGSSEPQWCKDEPSDWPIREDIIPANIERKANSVDIPLSLRIIKSKLKKQQWQEGLFFREAGESTYCSVKKAFSSMVFIIRELHSYTLQMRELLFYEDLQGIWDRVQKEMHASFVWLFEKVFSRTPTLMVYVMILLANFTVHSMSINSAIALEIETQTRNMETVSPFNVDQGADDVDERKVANTNNQKFDSSAIKSFSVASSSGGKSACIGGSNSGGGGKVRPVVSGTDGDGLFDGSENHHRTILPGDGVSQASVSGQDEGEVEEEEEEVRLWNSIVDEASRMQAVVRDEVLDNETIQSFVSPVTAKVEEEAAAAAAAAAAVAEHATDHAVGLLHTEFVYQTGLAQEPDNPLLLANYAQFLYTALNDYDRAEEYFKRAIEAEPKDAEAYSKYAIFLWQARNDLWAAEETFQEAIATDPDNAFYAANYAHFLWNTGAEDTCFPLSPPDSPLDE